MLDMRTARLNCNPETNSVLNNSTLTPNMGGSAADWLACWTQAQKGLGSNRSRDVVG